MTRITNCYNIADSSICILPDLRSYAIKQIVVITDDNSSITANNFETSLFDLVGTAANRKYVMHGLIGVNAKNTSEPHLPTDPVLIDKGATTKNTGSRWQNEIMMTGGLRWGLCDTTNYSNIL